MRVRRKQDAARALRPAPQAEAIALVEEAKTMAKPAAKRTRSGTSNGGRQRRAAVASGEATPSVRKPAEAPLSAPFYVAVDRQLKSGHETYEAAEKAARAIKKRYARLLVTVYEAETRRHTIIEQPKPEIVLHRNLAALAARDALERGRASVAGTKH